MRDVVDHLAEMAVDHAKLEQDRLRYLVETRLGCRGPCRRAGIATLEQIAFLAAVFFGAVVARAVIDGGIITATEGAERRDDLARLDLFRRDTVDPLLQLLDLGP